MSVFFNIYHIIFYKPLFNALVFLINIVPSHDVGIAVIILTVFVRTALFPFTHRSIKTQLKMRKAEPDIKLIKEKHSGDRQKQTEEIMKLYREHGISPYSGCLMLIIQLPLLIALYQVFWKGLAFESSFLYGFLTPPALLKNEFLGLVDMVKPSYVLAFLAGISQYFQIKLATLSDLKTSQIQNKKQTEQLSFQEYFSKSFSRQTMYVMPFFIFLISMRLPGAVALYWTTMNIFAILHESVVRRRIKKV